MRRCVDGVVCVVVDFLVLVAEGHPAMAEETAEDEAEHDLRYHQGRQGLGLPTGGSYYSRYIMLHRSML